MSSSVLIAVLIVCLMVLAGMMGMLGGYFLFAGKFGARNSDLSKLFNSISEEPPAPLTRPPESPPVPQAGSQDIARPASQDIARPVSQDIARPASQDIARPASQDIGGPASQDIAGPASQDIARPVSQDIPPPDPAGLPTFAPPQPAQPAQRPSQGDLSLDDFFSDFSVDVVNMSGDLEQTAHVADLPASGSGESASPESSAPESSASRAKTIAAGSLDSSSD